jgi:phage shock protein C
MTAEKKRLHKSRTDRMIDGVCGGIAAYFGMDSTLVRVLWVLLTIFGGSGLILYIVAMIVMPKEEPATQPVTEPPTKAHTNTTFWGILLVIVGAIWLLSNLGLPICFHWFGFPWHIGVPVLFIIAGIAFLFGSQSQVTSQSASVGDQTGPSAPAPSFGTVSGPTDRLYRSRTDKKLMGVCGGIAAYMNIDPVIVRLMVVAGALVSHGLFIILYIIMGIVVPREPDVAPAV